MSNIAFLKTPPLICLSGNPIVYGIIGKNAFTDNYQFSGELSFPEIGITAGKKITITWGGKTVVFTCSGQDDEDILSFAPISIMLAWCELFKKSALLYNDFEITASENKVLFHARKSGADYILSISSDWEYMGQTYPALNGYLSVEPPAPEDYYRIGVKINIDGELVSVDFPVSRLTNEVLPAGFTYDKSGMAEVDLKEFFKREILKHFTFPEPELGFSFKKDILLQSFIYAYQKKGIPVIEGSGLESDPFYVLQGKLSNFSQGALNDLDKSFYDKLLENGMFLTNAPAEKTTDIYAPERLYFLFTTPGTYKLYVKEYYSDGTINNQLRESMVIDSVQVREILCSYKRIRKNSPKVVTKYEVFITTNTDAQFSEIRTFYIDYSFQSYARYFLFLNQYGVYELVRTTGKVKKTEDIKKAFVSIPLSINFSETDKEEKQISADVSVNYSLNSGYFTSKYEAEWFREFMESKDVHWLKKGKAYPVSIQDSKTEVSNDSDFNPNRDFNLVHAIHDDFTEEFTTDSPIIIGDFNLDFSTDFFLGDETEAAPAGEVVFSSVFASWAQNFTWNMSLPSDFNWVNLGGPVSGPKGSVTNENNQARITTGSAGSPSWNQINFQPKTTLNAGSYSISFDLPEMDPLANLKIITNDGVIFSTKEAGHHIVLFNISAEGFNLNFIGDDSSARSCLLDNLEIKKLS